MANHKWNIDKCDKCNVIRKRATFKLLMAMVGSKDYYKYETGYVYYLPDGSKVKQRPTCNK